MKKQLLCLFALLTLAGGAFAQTIPSYVPTNGLVGWWPFNGNANDESGNGNNGTVNGATLTTDRIGNANSAYNFNGTSDYIFINPTNALGTSNAQVISFAYWINQKGVGSDIFDLRSTNNSNFGHWLDYQGTGGNLSNFSVINYNAPASEGQVWTSTEQIQKNNWYFVVTELDFSSGNLKMYFNGQLKSYTIINPTPVGGLDNPKLNIGSRFDFFNNRCCFFNGYLDDFAIYNRALTQQEITALYQGNNPVTTCPSLPSNLQNGLVGYWPFCGNANDESGNGNNGTVNGATLTTDRFGNINSSFYFDGNSFIDCGTSQTMAMKKNFTLNCWGKTSVNKNNQCMIGRWTNIENIPPYGTPEYCLYFSNNTVTSALVTSTPPTEYVDHSFVYADDQWHFYSMSFDGSVNKLYIDGQLVNSQTVASDDTIAIHPNKFVIGTYGLAMFPGNMGSSWEGPLDDASLYNRVLSAEEIANLYEINNPIATCPSLPANLQQGLAGYWPFCGNANDESGNGNNGTVNGATLTTDRFGNQGSAYQFDGVDDNITSQADFTSGSNQKSFSVWFKSDTITYNWLIAGGNDAICEAFGMYQDISHYVGNFNYDLFFFGSGLDCDHSISNYNKTIWNHAVVTFDGSQVKGFLNGNFISSRNVNLNTGSNSGLTFGSRSNGSALFDGSLDDIAIWNRALSPEEIAQLYQLQACATPLLLSLQDTTLTGTPGGSVQLQAQSNLDSTRFRWESDAAGLGWMAIRNNARYNGADSARLQVSNINLSNHLQRFRVLGQNGGCRDTSDVVVLQVSDTCINTITVYDTSLVSVTDTLRIDVPVFTAGNPEQINTLKVYPVPATNMLYINTGNYASMPGHSIKITRINGQNVVFEASANEPLLEISLSDFGANGVYFLNLYNASGALVTSRKIVLY